MTTREKAKLQRRAAIIDAARALMQASGTAGFSMRALADLAGVSIATPYNLFGSKQAIMIAILETEMQAYRSELAQVQTDALEALFRAVLLATRRYRAAPGFYRALLFSVYSDGGTDFRSLFSGASHALWHDLVARAIASGHLSDALDPNALAFSLEQIFFACLLEWVFGLLSMDELELRVQYGFALALLGMARQPGIARLQARVMDTQGALQNLWAHPVAGGRFVDADTPITSGA